MDKHSFEKAMQKISPYIEKRYALEIKKAFYKMIRQNVQKFYLKNIMIKHTDTEEIMI